jgi:ubiquinone/menaquinone biosynthesis C-methylase UbiE
MLAGMSADTAHAERNARKWDKRAETYDERRFDYFRWMQRRALSFLRIKTGMHFLDLGCGTGYAVRYVASKGDYDGCFYGIDISPRMIDVAREDSIGLKNLRFEVASADKLPLGAGFFDAVLCTNSFHHYESPVKALREIHRVLKPGGGLCIVDVTADNRLVRWMDVRTRKREPEHVRFYSTAEYAKMLDEADLRRVMSKTILPPLKAHIAEK